MGGFWPGDVPSARDVLGRSLVLFGLPDGLPRPSPPRALGALRRPCRAQGGTPLESVSVTAPGGSAAVGSMMPPALPPPVRRARRVVFGQRRPPPGPPLAERRLEDLQLAAVSRPRTPSRATARRGSVQAGHRGAERRNTARNATEPFTVPATSLEHRDRPRSASCVPERHLFTRSGPRIPPVGGMVDTPRTGFRHVAASSAPVGADADHRVIHHLHLVDGAPKKEIARRLRLDVNRCGGPSAGQRRRCGDRRSGRVAWTRGGSGSSSGRARSRG